MKRVFFHAPDFIYLFTYWMYVLIVGQVAQKLTLYLVQLTLEGFSR